MHLWRQVELDELLRETALSVRVITRVSLTGFSYPLLSGCRSCKHCKRCGMQILTFSNFDSVIYQKSLLSVEPYQYPCVIYQY